MNKIKQKPAYIFFSLLAVMILFYVSIAFGVTLRNSFKAYEMIKYNYIKSTFRPAMITVNTAGDRLKSVTAAVKDALIARARKFLASPAPK